MRHQMGWGELERPWGVEEGLTDNESNWQEHKEMAIPETTENKVIVMIVIKQRE